MIKRCIVCGTLTEIKNDSSVTDDVIEEKCLRCLNSSNTSSLKRNTPVRSLFYIFDGFTYLFKSGKLFKLSIVPLLLTSFILFIMYASFLYFFISELNQYLPSYEVGGVFSILNDIGRYLLGIFGSLLIALILLFSFLPISSIICIPFNDIISIETETLFLGEQDLGNKPGKFIDEVKVGAKEVFKLLFFKLIILVLTLPVLLIPVAGWILFIFVLSLITAIDFLDVVMARKKYSLNEKLDFIKRNKMSFTMFSLPFLLLFWIPIIQIFIIPSATIAGTKFFLEAEKKGEE